jgi:DNA polymerase-4
MQQTLVHDAAPMHIPFLHIPETDTVDELFLQRERQFKVLAENAHREAQKRQASFRIRRKMSNHSRPARAAGTRPGSGTPSPRSAKPDPCSDVLDRPGLPIH